MLTCVHLCNLLSLSLSLSLSPSLSLSFLTCTAPPPPLTLSLTPSSPVTVVQGDNTVVTCSAPDGIHLTSIQWTRGSNAITTGVARTANSLALAVSNVQLQDGGNYVCMAVDSFGDTETVTAVLVIDGTYIMDKVVVSCRYDIN